MKRADWDIFRIRLGKVRAAVWAGFVCRLDGFYPASSHNGYICSCAGFDDLALLLYRREEPIRHHTACATSNHHSWFDIVVDCTGHAIRDDYRPRELPSRPIHSRHKLSLLDDSHSSLKYVYRRLECIKALHHYTVLDIALSSILLHYLTRSMKQVYATQIRKRIARLMAIVWQSAVPPTLCTICLCIFYIQFSLATRVCPHFHSLRRDLGIFRYAFMHGWTLTTICHPQKRMQMWYTFIQGMVGKLYVLSLFYIINDHTLTGGQPSSFDPTLTIPNEAYDTFSLDTRVGGAAAC
ncbi:hypothetical protein BJV78DRAFT_1204188 [Lactifluus subvellereus]|nr:hypothetical protein BJV78DRAFT_1204188 [Lactifluus subvellereus]